MTKPQIGFSTGCLHHTHTTKQALAALRGKCAVVELCFVKYDPVQWGWLDEIEPDDLAGFNYVSFHAPKYAYRDDATSRTILGRIKEFSEHTRQLNTVVVHPDEVADFRVLAQSGLPVALENMDWRKSSFKNAEDLQELFRKFPALKFVLDLNHVFTNDHSMLLADRLHEAFDDRLAHYHLSGFTELHDPLFETRQQQIVTAIRREDVPIIMESDLTATEVESERDYVQDSLPGSHRSIE